MACERCKLSSASVFHVGERALGSKPWPEYLWCDWEVGQARTIITLLLWRRTALHLAARSCDADMLKTLLENVDEAKKPALVNQTDNFGITPIFLAVQK